MKTMDDSLARSNNIFKKILLLQNLDSIDQAKEKDFLPILHDLIKEYKENNLSIVELSLNCELLLNIIPLDKVDDYFYHYGPYKTIKENLSIAHLFTCLIDIHPMFYNNKIKNINPSQKEIKNKCVESIIIILNDYFNKHFLT